MGTSALSSADARLAHLADRDADFRSALEEALATLGTAVAFDHAALLVADPQTLLPTAGLVKGISADTCGAFWNAEFTGSAFNRFTDLARAADPVATLLGAVAGEVKLARGYLSLFGPEFADELRVAFVSDGTCRGFAHVLRETPFSSHEVEQVRNLSKLIARALHHAGIPHSPPGSGSGMVVADPGGEIIEATVDGRRMLDELRSNPPFDAARSDRLPALLGGLLAQARAEATGQAVSTRVRGSSGAWYRVSAALTEARDRIAVMVEPARTADLIPLALEGFGLTAREAVIAKCLARGLTDKEIAAELYLSPHTVRDHVKAVLSKCGASSRGELVARIFVDHLQPSLEREIAHVA